MSLLRSFIVLAILAGCAASHPEPGDTVLAEDFCLRTRPALCRFDPDCSGSSADNIEDFCSLFAAWPALCIPEPTESDVAPCVDAVQALTELADVCDLPDCRALCRGTYCE